MQTYTEDELTNKIHAFMTKKSQKFPGLEARARRPVRKVPIDYHQPGLMTTLESLNTFWIRRVHP